MKFTKHLEFIMYKIVEKRNSLAVHGVFATLERAEKHLVNKIPEYCARGFFMDKSLTKDSFQIISPADESAQAAVQAVYDAAQESASAVRDALYQSASLPVKGW